MAELDLDAIQAAADATTDAAIEAIADGLGERMEVVLEPLHPGRECDGNDICAWAQDAAQLVSIYRNDLRAARAEVRALQVLALEQWEILHDEFCGKRPIYHEGECYRPMPEILRAMK